MPLTELTKQFSLIHALLMLDSAVAGETNCIRLTSKLDVTVEMLDRSLVYPYIHLESKVAAIYLFIQNLQD